VQVAVDGDAYLLELVRHGGTYGVRLDIWIYFAITSPWLANNAYIIQEPFIT